MNFSQTSCGWDEVLAPTGHVSCGAQSRSKIASQNPWSNGHPWTVTTIGWGKLPRLLGAHDSPAGIPEPGGFSQEGVRNQEECQEGFWWILIRFWAKWFPIRLCHWKKYVPSTPWDWSLPPHRQPQSLLHTSCWFDWSADWDSTTEKNDLYIICV